MDNSFLASIERYILRNPGRNIIDSDVLSEILVEHVTIIAVGTSKSAQGTLDVLVESSREFHVFCGIYPFAFSQAIEKAEKKISDSVR